MKKFFIIILSIVIAAILAGSLLSVSAMEQNGHMKCAVSKMAGSSQCFFALYGGVAAMLEHITFLMSSFQVVSISSLFILSGVIMAVVVIFWRLERKNSENFFNQLSYRQFYYHNNNAFFPWQPPDILAWLCLLIRGDGLFKYIRAYNHL